jgi:hypothetical protein
MRQLHPDLWRLHKQFWDFKSWWRDWLKLVPYEISSAKPRLVRLVGLCRSHHEGSRGAQEPLDPRDLWLRWSLQHYIWPKTLFSRGTTKSYEIASPLAANLRGGILYSNKAKKKGGQGGGAPLGSAVAGVPCAAAGDVPPPLPRGEWWCGVKAPSWEPQEEGMMSTATNFPQLWNQGLSNQ